MTRKIMIVLALAGAHCGLTFFLHLVATFRSGAFNEFTSQTRSECIASSVVDVLGFPLATVLGTEPLFYAFNGLLWAVCIVSLCGLFQRFLLRQT